MSIEAREGLYEALRQALRQSDTALTCAELFDLPTVKKHAETVNRVSDYLGNLWRRGDVLRVAAPPAANTRARWAYAWKEKVRLPVTLEDIERGVVATSERVESLLSRPNLEITEEGKTIVITTQHCTITVKTN
jgi:predicted Zn-ribbon and HTH transcriptional regulator